jgi:branched-subunit amino acid transport protein AzlD
MWFGFQFPFLPLPNKTLQPSVLNLFKKAIPFIVLGLFVVMAGILQEYFAEQWTKEGEGVAQA